MKTMRAAVVAGMTVAVTIGMSTAANAAGENSGVSSHSGGGAPYLWKYDQIRLSDTNADGFSIYAQYKINEKSVLKTSQHNGGFNTTAYKTIGPLKAGNFVDVRGGLDVEGGADKYGPWRRGVA